MSSFVGDLRSRFVAMSLSCLVSRCGQSCLAVLLEGECQALVQHCNKTAQSYIDIANCGFGLTFALPIVEQSLLCFPLTLQL